MKLLTIENPKFKAGDRIKCTVPDLLRIGISRDSIYIAVGDSAQAHVEATHPLYGKEVVEVVTDRKQGEEKITSDSFGIREFHEHYEFYSVDRFILNK